MTALFGCEDLIMPSQRALAVAPVPTVHLNMPSEAASETSTVAIELVTAIIAVIDDEPVVRVLPGSGSDATRVHLPTVWYQPQSDGSLEDGLRLSVHQSTGLDLGYVEQLQTVVTRSAALTARLPDAAVPVAMSGLAIGYLALAHGVDSPDGHPKDQWQSWYSFLPWEDWRRGKPSVLTKLVEPRLNTWVEEGAALPSDPAGLGRADRVRMAFGMESAGWDEEKVLERYDVLFAAGLLAETQRGSSVAGPSSAKPELAALGVAMHGHHRRNLAMAISRLRTKIKSRPVVFELMPERFTLYELQRTVEAILGPHLHKQNFRRLVEHMGLVEPTEEIKNHTGGRPAKLFRFRQSVLWERLHPGVRVRGARA
jgi:hypothetical protein